MKIETQMAGDRLQEWRIGEIFRIVHAEIVAVDRDWYAVSLDLERVPVVDPNDPPVVDGCKVVDRGDGHYTCKIHYRYWPKGSGICPGRNS